MIEILNYNENLTRGARSNTGTCDSCDECNGDHTNVANEIFRNLVVLLTFDSSWNACIIMERCGVIGALVAVLGQTAPRAFENKCARAQTIECSKLLAIVAAQSPSCLFSLFEKSSSSPLTPMLTSPELFQSAMKIVRAVIFSKSSSFETKRETLDIVCESVRDSVKKSHAKQLLLFLVNMIHTKSDLIDPFVRVYNNHDLLDICLKHNQELIFTCLWLLRLSSVSFSERVFERAVTSLGSCLDEFVFTSVTRLCESDSPSEESLEKSTDSSKKRNMFAINLLIRLVPRAKEDLQKKVVSYVDLHYVPHSHFTENNSTNYARTHHQVHRIQSVILENKQRPIRI